VSLLIAVKSCQRDRSLHETIRQTWGFAMPAWVTLRFFMGGLTGTTKEDEIELDCPDDYRSLPNKTRAITRWFLDSQIDSHIFLCDNDTHITPGFLELDYPNYDYAGRFNYWPTGAKMGTTFRYNDGQGNVHDPCHAWASGGFGYFLSRKAAKIVTEMIPVSWAEDLSVGQVLGPKIRSGEIVGHEFNYDCVWHKGVR
jgi:hypothetical protein